MSNTTEIKSKRDVQHTGQFVRAYSPIPSQQFYAYRSKDGTEHICVRDDDDYGHRVDRIPAVITDPDEIPDKRWTIPDNWNKIVHSSRDMISYGIWYIPEADTHVKASIATNDHVVDCWFGIKSIGDLTFEPVGSVGSANQFRAAADDLKADGPAESEKDAEIIRKIAENIDIIRAEANGNAERAGERILERAYEARTDRAHTETVNANFDWELVSQYRIHRFEEFFSHEFHIVSPYMDEIIRFLRHRGLLPETYSVKIAITEDTD